MIDKKTVDVIEQGICYELQNAVKNYGANYNTNHEGYGVLLEEVEEAQDCMDLIQSHLAEVWKSIKINFNPEQDLYAIYESSKALAEEAIQIAAVCEKFRDSIK